MESEAARGNDNGMSLDTKHSLLLRCINTYIKTPKRMKNTTTLKKPQICSNVQIRQLK